MVQRPHQGRPFGRDQAIDSHGHRRIAERCEHLRPAPRVPRAEAGGETALQMLSLSLTDQAGSTPSPSQRGGFGTTGSSSGSSGTS